ncbi:hypothetical protein [uncultured Shimia sp.]|uniref:hypothetical protein n=1 Tax=uncultured Shimia sp. TaxID=573152 RepID=UPI00261F89BF|nr:hypothetical protein [uncultured Shimia sp.]
MAEGQKNMESLDAFIAKLSLGAASKFLIVLPSLFLIFHLLIIAGVLPHSIVWGGRLTDQTMLPFELLALVLNLLLMLVGGVAGGFVTSSVARSVVARIQWFLFYFVVVNTVLALFSTTLFEVLLTPVTAIYAVCLYRIARFGGVDVV